MDVAPLLLYQGIRLETVSVQRYTHGTRPWKPSFITIKIPFSSTYFHTPRNRCSDDFCDYPRRKFIQYSGKDTGRSETLPTCIYLSYRFPCRTCYFARRWCMTGSRGTFYAFIKPLRWKESRERLFKRFKGRRRRRLTTTTGADWNTERPVTVV